MAAGGGGPGIVNLGLNATTFVTQLNTAINATANFNTVIGSAERSAQPVQRHRNQRRGRHRQPERPVHRARRARRSPGNPSAPAAARLGHPRGGRVQPLDRLDPDDHCRLGSVLRPVGRRHPKGLRPAWAPPGRDLGGRVRPALEPGHQGRGHVRHLGCRGQPREDHELLSPGLGEQPLERDQRLRLLEPRHRGSCRQALHHGRPRPREVERAGEPDRPCRRDGEGSRDQLRGDERLA